jgi:hypothetical protein
MRIPHLYIESTIFNFAFYGKGLEKQVYAQRLFEAIGAGTFLAFTSEYVTGELKKDSSEKRQKMLGLIDKHKIKINRKSDDIENLALEYVAQGIIPEKYENDALHIAAAAINGIDFVVSYNYNHIVKLKTIIGTGLINRRRDLPIVGLATPKEVLDYGTRRND